MAGCYLTRMEWIEVEVVVALPELQRAVKLRLPSGSCAQEAISQSGLLKLSEHCPSESLGMGVFGKQVPPTHILREGDRVEIYRSLIMDPKEARRLRASRQATSGRSKH